MAKRLKSRARPNPVKRTVVEDRRATILELAVMGYSTRQMAAKLGTTIDMVQRDMKVVRERRILEGLVLDDQLAQRSIARYERFIQLAYEGYQRSLKDELTIEEELAKVKRGAERLHIVKRKSRSQAGSSGFVNSMIMAQSRIDEINGLIGKDRFEGTTPDQTPKFVRIVVESREDVAEYESLRLEQLKSSNIVEGVVQQSAGQGVGADVD